ncbi:hypothetical protein HG530_007746 [Fusarium avenaceum]|nr:hypothetical protein HG530_007746 [Fusarium avenaceum]
MAKSFGTTQSLLKSIELAPQAVIDLFGSLCITSRANELRLLSFDAQHVAARSTAVRPLDGGGEAGADGGEGAAGLASERPARPRERPRRGCGGATGSSSGMTGALRGEAGPVGRDPFANVLRLGQIESVDFTNILALNVAFFTLLAAFGGSVKGFLLRSEQTFLFGGALSLDLLELRFQISLLFRGFSADVLVGSTEGFRECFEHGFRVDDLAAIVMENLPRKHVLDDWPGDVKFDIE